MGEDEAADLLAPDDPEDNCVCPTGKVERFVQACLLLFLRRGSSHGYELYQELASFGLEESLPDTATMYKNLRRMEARGLIVSQWQPGEAGPGRRSYSLTAKGLIYLDRWAGALAQSRSLIDRFLTEKQSLTNSGLLPAVAGVDPMAAGSTAGKGK